MFLKIPLTQLQLYICFIFYFEMKLVLLWHRVALSSTIEWTLLISIFCNQFYFVSREVLLLFCFGCFFFLFLSVFNWDELNARKIWIYIETMKGRSIDLLKWCLYESKDEWKKNYCLLIYVFIYLDRSSLQIPCLSHQLLSITFNRYEFVRKIISRHTHKNCF